MSLRRIAAAAGAALLALSLIAVPARADGSHECFSGVRTPDGEHYDLSAGGCAGAGYYQVTVVILVGDARGTYSCASVFSWNGSLTGERCLLL
ncbi:hypothetical protein [Nonomuraea gerenzanensis]|uniref:Secreted protein n=1 Tax=Nonomuraea gerenzanensis TaxID=93944 RepID=A0A1M4EJ69_9ACTN|nr:hypothetical protein [Nonomuraea gerenzanensis]UBU10235.1 hypothetical protein LCN96_38600 [Nonomuraea gerenzanensis]SBO98613.1 hypothetical protein BN4615_P8129 [Nonomuraea gerenzanensis]